MTSAKGPIDQYQIEPTFAGNVGSILQEGARTKIKRNQQPGPETLFAPTQNTHTHTHKKHTHTLRTMQYTVRSTHSHTHKHTQRRHDALSRNPWNTEK